MFHRLPLLLEELAVSHGDGSFRKRLNQLAKVASIFAGAYFAVGPGGQRGFVTGAAVGFVYMVLGYGVYWAFHGSVSAPLVMLGEMLLGAVLGALSGAVVANLRPKKRRKAA